MKVLEVDALELGIDEMMTKLTTLSNQMQEVEDKVNHLLSLSDAFKGEGAKAILTFYEQYHKPLLTTYHTLFTDYKATLQQMKNALFTLEPANTGYIRQSFLAGELEQGITRARETTMELTDEANNIMDSVSDIVSLPHLKDDGVIQAATEATKYKDDTIEKLVQFDADQTQALVPVEDILESIIDQINYMEDIFSQGNLTINSEAKPVEDLSCEQPVSPEVEDDKAWYEIVGDVIIGIIDGIVRAIVDIFKGLYELLKALFTDPIGFLKGIYTAVTNPIDTLSAMWEAITVAWERDVVNGDAKSRASFFSYAIVSVVGLKGIDKVGKLGKASNAASKVDGPSPVPYNAMKTDKLKETVKTNVFTNAKNKLDEFIAFTKSGFFQGIINQAVKAVNNSKVMTTARNVLNPDKIKSAIQQTYNNVIKSPLASTKSWIDNNFGKIPVSVSVGIKSLITSNGIKTPYIDVETKELRDFYLKFDADNTQSQNMGINRDKDNGLVELRTIISPEMEAKILEGHRKVPKNVVIGGHSPSINNDNDNFAVEVLSTNVDGTKNVVFTKQFPDGNISKLKKSTLFPETWSDDQILNSVIEVGNTPAISTRLRDGATWHRAIINGIEIDVLKIGDDVTSAYPTGNVNAPRPSGF